MTLNYNILWFEDDSSYVESLKPLLKECLDELGFELKLEVVPDGNNLIELIDNGDWHLILMDFQLNSGSPKGDELISRIRKYEIYTEIIFYSEHSNFKDGVIKRDLPDGIYFARGRKYLFEKIKSIINLTLKRHQDINNMRGLVIAETIDIEVKMDNIILTYFGLHGEKEIVFKKIFEPKFDLITTKKKSDLINKICKERIISLNKEFDELPAEKIERKEELRKKLVTLEMLKGEFEKIEDEIINIRNILAHTRENNENRNTLISQINNKEKKIVVNDEWCKNTRKDIRKHSINLDKIIEHI